jgi:hypothetical protein
MTIQNVQTYPLRRRPTTNFEVAMPWFLASLGRWRAARRAAHLERIQKIVSKGLSAIE